MCTRRQAIAIIVKEKRGTIDAIKDQIGELYESFVILGFIRERIFLSKLSSNTSELIEWEVTERAVKKHKFYSLLPE